MKVYANMIVGERPEPFLRWSLRSVVPLVDKVVVCLNTVGGVDLKSTYNYRILTDSEFEGKLDMFVVEEGFKDFSQVRNACLDRSAEADWILRLDADEVLYTGRFNNVIRGLPSLDAMGARVVWWYFYHFLRDLKTVHNNRGLDGNFLQRFLFKNDGICWSEGVHEVPFVDGQISDAQASYSVVMGDYIVAHYGYCLPDVWIFDKWEQYQHLTSDPNFYDYMSTDSEKCKTIDEYMRPWNILQDREGFEFVSTMGDLHPETVRTSVQSVERELADVTADESVLVYYNGWMERHGLQKPKV